MDSAKYVPLPRHRELDPGKSLGGFELSMDLFSLFCFSGTGHIVYQWPKQSHGTVFCPFLQNMCFADFFWPMDFWSLDNGQRIRNDLRRMEDSARNVAKSQLCRTTSGRQWTAAGFFIHF